MKFKKILIVTLFTTFLLTACSKENINDNLSAPTPELTITEIPDNNILIPTTQPIEELKNDNELGEEIKEKIVDCTYQLYYPNKDYTKFETIEQTVNNIDDLPVSILISLHENGTLKENVRLLSFTVNDNSVTINLSDNFKTIMETTGSSSEYFIMGSIVNSLIDAYCVDEVTVLVMGNSFESGHAEYNKPLTFFE